MILADYANRGEGYAQFGEEALLRRVFEVIGEGDRVCCEAGAYDGLDCSNTAHLWRDAGWQATLIEADAERFDLLAANTDAYHNVSIHNQAISAGNVNVLVPDPCDLFSLDIDGNEYGVLSAMHVRPRVLIVEFNSSIPWWMDIHPVNQDGCFGSSASAIVRVVEALPGRYSLLEAVGVNLIFVDTGTVTEPQLQDLTGMRSAVGVLEDWNDRENPLTYMATDYRGRPRLLGGPPPWGVLWDEQCTEALCETDHR